MLQPAGRVIMVSGASRGIGRAIAQRLVLSGFRVSGGVRKPDAMHGSYQIMYHRYDAEEKGSAEAWVDATVTHFGGVDGVINAAGINPKVTVDSDEEDLLDEMWRVNVKGPLRVIRAALPFLRVCGHGRVINVGSLSSKRVASNVGYAMTKFAVAALTHGVRREGRADGIRATVLCPGFVATDMTLKDDAVPRAEMTQPEDLAELVETLLRLPNNAGVSELLVHCQFDPML